jgi:hypothetical protein
MFFVALIAIPVAAGLVAGSFASTRRPADALAAVCVLLGVAGSLATVLDDDTTDRAASAAFGVTVGVLAAALVYGGWWIARGAMRVAREKAAGG